MVRYQDLDPMITLFRIKKVIVIKTKWSKKWGTSYLASRNHKKNIIGTKPFNLRLINSFQRALLKGKIDWIIKYIACKKGVFRNWAIWLKRNGSSKIKIKVRWVLAQGSMKTVMKKSSKSIYHLFSNPRQKKVPFRWMLPHPKLNSTTSPKMILVSKQRKWKNT